MGKNTMTHEDFGEKIGGARKDQWYARGLCVSDLEEMNDAEMQKYVTKNYVWKKPDYEAMIKDGVSAEVVYFIKKVRDSVNVVPDYVFLSADDKEKIQQKNREYVDTVRKLKEVVESVRTVADCLGSYDRFLKETGMTDKGFVINTALNHNTKSIMRLGNAANFDWHIARDARRKQFGVSKEEKIPAGYFVRQNREGSYNPRESTPGTYYYGKGHIIIQDNIPTKEEAVKAAQAHAETSRTKNGKQKFTPPQLEDIERDGRDYLGGRHVTGEDYLETFKFRGGEFGNWLNQEDRQASLDMGFEALKDLADALKVTDGDISLDGKLAIAFGARGQGKAAAHYEPLRQVINLTKMHGAGSLAHEWWHAFDHFMGCRVNGSGYLSERPSTWAPMKELVDVIECTEKTVPTEEQVKQDDKLIAQNRVRAENVLIYAMGRGFTEPSAPEKIRTEFARLKSDFLEGKEGSVDALSDLRRTVKGHILPKSTRTTLETYMRIFRSVLDRPDNTAGTTARVITEYFRNSKKFDGGVAKDGDYWASAVEMTARAFACYVMDKLENRSDYLVGHAETACMPLEGKNGELEIVCAFPRGEERKRINQAFEKLFEAVKSEGVFTFQEHPEPLAKTAMRAIA